MQLKVLAVDDDRDVLDLLKVLLGDQENIDLLTCASARQARWILRSGTEIDCFLLDINMPDEDGISLCAAIREMPEHEETPIIMLTVNRDWESIRRSFDAGATDYVTKPVESVELIARVNMSQRFTVARQSAAEWVRSANEIYHFSEPALDGLTVHEANYLGVPNALEYLRLENFLHRLDLGVIPMDLLAIRIGGLMDNFSDPASLPERFSVLKALLAGLAGCVPDEMLVSYAGQGVFVCVKFGGRTLKASSVVTAVQSALGELFLLSPEELEDCFEISVMRTCQRKILAGPQAAKYLRSALRTQVEVDTPEMSERELRRLFDERTGSGSWRRSLARDHFRQFLGR